MVPFVVSFQGTHPFFWGEGVESNPLGTSLGLEISRMWPSPPVLAKQSHPTFCPKMVQTQKVSKVQELVEMDSHKYRAGLHCGAGANGCPQIGQI